MRILIVSIAFFLTCHNLLAQELRCNEDLIKKAIRNFVNTASHTSEAEHSQKLFKVRTFLGGTIDCVKIYPKRLKFRSLAIQALVKSAIADVEIGCRGRGDKAYVNSNKIGLEFQGDEWIITSVE